eukprot:SAG22_NODE_6078_length_903_cov_1.411692_2_plen_95_part_00
MVDRPRGPTRDYVAAKLDPVVGFSSAAELCPAAHTCSQVAGDYDVDEMIQHCINADCSDVIIAETIEKRAEYIDQLLNLDDFDLYLTKNNDKEQ